MTPEEKKIVNLKVHRMKRRKYEKLLAANLINDDEFYMIYDQNEKTEYGDLYGDIEYQSDLVNYINASNFHTMEYLSDEKSYSAIKALKDNSEETGEDKHALPDGTIVTIPYIKAITGIKIVDKANVKAVDDYYSATGKGNYVIIDETTEEFRLPLPDVYSLIEENTATFAIRKWENEE